MEQPRDYSWLAVEKLEAGRAAAAGEAWEEARKALTEADHQEPLSPTDLELLADAAWWAGYPEESVEVLERAYSGHLAAGMRLDAARVAILLGYLAARRLAMSVTSGWHSIAAGLLEDQPESEVHALLRTFELAEKIAVRQDMETGLRLADDVIDLARRTGSRDSESEAKALKGYALIATGHWMEGLSLIDEATAIALAGESGLRAASDVYCVTIAACRGLADIRRAGEWTEKADQWMTRHSVGGYPGVCRVHRAELKRLQGDWPEAEREALDACQELERYRIVDGVALAQNEVGEIRLHMGDLAGAEEAFTKAYEAGHDPQPGLAMLMLARGRADEAAHALKRSLDQESNKANLLNRLNLLPAQVEVALARGDLETARLAAMEMARLADDYQQPVFQAVAMTVRGEVALHEDDVTTAIDLLGQAWRRWNEAGIPYDAARARALLGQAHLAAGEIDLARMELGAARSVFERLGAKPDLRQVEAVLFSLDAGRVGERVARTFLFTDIVTSTDLIGVIGDERWESLLAWHDRTLRAAFVEHNGVEVNHTGDGFFVSFDAADDAIEAAVTIQRRLASHRREHGFAPTVRIGVHTDEATLDGDDYRGRGVHLASRVGSAAEGDEIVVSAATLESANGPRHPVSGPRSVELKGIDTPVRLHTVNWKATAATG
jgi:class 3 adenylate cyclase